MFKPVLPLESVNAHEAPMYKYFRKIFIGLAVVIAVTACTSPATHTDPAATVEIIRTETGFQLLRNGERYEIRGAGMVHDDFAAFTRRGGNSIRTWTTRDDEGDMMALMDQAHAHGVTVALTLPMPAERHGFDYDDEDAVAATLGELREDILRFRDHPALLFWIIGNELNHSYTNPRVWDAVNDVARMIHELDPHHPATTALAGSSEDVVLAVLSRAPDLDFLSFQVYGRLFELPQQLERLGFDQPFMITEWGTIGWWEMETTTWGAPVELTSSEKAEVYRRGHRDILTPLADQLIGSYAFVWGQKQERTPTWFGMLTSAGEQTEAIDAMEWIWTGQRTRHPAPRVENLLLDGRSARDNVIVLTGEEYEAWFEVAGADAISYRWEVKPESDATQVGGDYEEPIAPLEGLLSAPDSARTSLAMPERGAYRLFAYASDDNSRAAHANIPFLVEDGFRQSPDSLIEGQVMAVAYSGFREGQHPDRGEGAVNPSREEILEDLELLVAHGFHLIRLYDAGANSRTTLELIREHELPIKVLLGTWLRAELSNHEGCPWLDEPIPDHELTTNTAENAAEIERGIELARAFDDIVVAVNVGNEALVDWTDHLVELDQVIAYVRRMREAIDQPVTVAENYEWWIRDGAPLAAEVDFLGVHTYPVWEERSIDQGLSYTVENLIAVHQALPDKPMAVLEAGWATTASEFGERASEAAQARYYREIQAWASQTNITVFFFAAFDEPWKGDPDDPLGAEKHWGLFFEDRSPKKILRDD
ncbi:MAG: hypothetical protein EA370_05200 [Wenzhouxiangella sp.]|nr:MAG: hypothetical protein EA370_05200 [Wenzhouxiangella sp.]